MAAVGKMAAYLVADPNVKRNYSSGGGVISKGVGMVAAALLTITPVFVKI